MIQDAFAHNTYIIRRKFWNFLHRGFHIYDAQSQLIGYCRKKAFKLREDLQVYTNDSMQTTILSIKARNIIDFSATYDVTDPLTGERVGALRRQGLHSLARDRWLVLDPSDVEICVIEEDSLMRALLRRNVQAAAALMPQRYTGKAGDRVICHFRQNFNPFILKIALDFTEDHDDLLDRRLGVAAAILLCAIEGRQG